jgi:hypothetical protein
VPNEPTKTEGNNGKSSEDLSEGQKTGDRNDGDVKDGACNCGKQTSATGNKADDESVRIIKVTEHPFWFLPACGAVLGAMVGAVATSLIQRWRPAKEGTK